MKMTDMIEGKVVILELSGKIMGGKEIDRFHDKIHEHLKAGRKLYVVDMKRVTFTNSSGLGMLIRGYASVTKADGKMVLANITNIQDLLAMTRLLTVFDTYDSREEAIAALLGDD
ncbi:MAG: STAS domain-containing protein [Candidatus Zixiibacteriota bacterium]|nr:MAG: STAS domain-containing protein [candidate division Zixibacteria bacterium]